MGEAFLDYKKGGSGGLDINGIIEDYYVYAGENVNAGDFVEFINGVAGKTTETSSAIELSNQKYSAYSASAVALDNNRVFIAHCMDSSNYYLYGIVCAIDGATVTAGSDTQLSTVVGSGYMISTVLLKDGKVFIAHSHTSGSYYLYGMVCTINGTTITTGTDTSIYASSYGAYKISTELLPSGEIFIAHSGNGTNYHLYYTLCTVSGTAISISQATTTLNSNKRAGHAISTALMPNGNVFIAHGSSSFYMSGVIISKSGTTVTAGTTVQLSTETYRAPGQLVVLDANRVFIPHSYTSSGYMMITIAKVSGTTISEYKSTEQITTPVNSGNTPRAVLMPNGKILVMHNISSLLYGMVCTVDDMTVTTGVDTNMSSICRIIGSTFLINGNIFVCEALYTTDYHLYAQLFNIDDVNNVPTNQITIAEYEIQVRPATTLPCNGVAKTSGMGAYKVVEYTVAEGETINSGDKVEIVEQTFTDDIIPKVWTKTDAQNFVSDNGTKLYGSLEPTYDNDSSGVATMCDGNLTTGYQARNSYSMFGRLTFTDKIKITKMKIKASISTANLFSQLIIRGGESNKPANTLHTVTTQDQISSNLTEIELTSPDYYTEYTCMLSATTSTQVTHTLYEWQVSEYCKTVVKKATSSYNGTALQNGTAGDTIQIAVPISNEESTAHKDVVSVYVPDV